MQERIFTPSSFQKDGRFLMLALDHRESFRNMLKAGGGGTTEEAVVRSKQEIIEALGTLPSGVLIDIEYGLPAFRASHIDLPYLLAMEKSGYELVGEDRHTELLHMAPELKREGASGAKLLLYMRGDGSDADAHQTEIARSAAGDASQEELPFFLEVVIYGSSAVGEKTLAALETLMSAGVSPSVWKLSYPGSPELCKSITQQVQGTPWILLSRGAPFEQFLEEVYAASRCGALGVLAGRALWQEALALSGTARETFLRDTLPDRFKRLAAAVE